MKNSKANLAVQDEAAALVAECKALIEAERNAINARTMTSSSSGSEARLAICRV